MFSVYGSCFLKYHLMVGGKKEAQELPSKCCQDSFHYNQTLRLAFKNILFRVFFSPFTYSLVCICGNMCACLYFYYYCYFAIVSYLPSDVLETTHYGTLDVDFPSSMNLSLKTLLLFSFSFNRQYQNADRETFSIWKHIYLASSSFLA